MSHWIRQKGKDTPYHNGKECLLVWTNTVPHTIKGSDMRSMVEAGGIEPPSKSRSISGVYSLSYWINLSMLRSISNLSHTDFWLIFMNIVRTSYIPYLTGYVTDSKGVSADRSAFASLCRLLSESVICSVSRYLFVHVTFANDCCLIQTDPCRIQDAPINKRVWELSQYRA